MSATLACLTGTTICRMIRDGSLRATELGQRDTPFGASAVIFRVEEDPGPYYVLPRQGPNPSCQVRSRADHRANLYALKDLGAEMVIDWAAAAAITHNVGIGQLVVLDDLLDMTHSRAETFFEDTGLGFLRQYPVFCPTLRSALAGVLAELSLPHRSGGTVAVTEGPRRETPAEVRMLAAVGAALVTHSMAPEFSLAKELQMCFAGVAYLVNYAETGSPHQPFSTGDLFGGLTEASQAQRIQRVAQALPEVAARLLENLPNIEPDCKCRQTMAHHVQRGDLPEDWRKWFGPSARR